MPITTAHDLAARACRFVRGCHPGAVLAAWDRALVDPPAFCCDEGDLCGACAADLTAIAA